MLPPVLPLLWRQSWDGLVVRFGPETKPSHQEAIPANTSATPDSAGSYNP